MFENQEEIKLCVECFIKLDAPHKSKYHMAETDMNNAVILVSEFIEKTVLFSLSNPFTGKFGHSISFEADERAVKRLGKKDAVVENALHYVTQSRSNGDYINKIFSQSKADSLKFLIDVLKNADEHVTYPNRDVFYYKMIKKESKRPYAVVLIKPIAESGVYRLTSFMPDKKRIEYP
jgi:hypothetical protein